MRHLFRTSLLTPVVYLLATSPSAFAVATKAPKGYAGVHANAQTSVVHANAQNAVASAGATASNGNLPFTGFDVTLMVIGVVVLVLLGAALRRFSGNHA
jgi:hypothetical protein